NSIARLLSGTLWGLPLFIRSPGIFHVASAKLISDQRAPKTSPGRAAVRIKSSRARADNSEHCPSSTRNAGTAAYGMAAEWVGLGLRLGSRFGRLAGLSERMSRAIAQSNTKPIRLLMRRAVTSLSRNGSRTDNTAATSTSPIGMSPILGKTCNSKEDIHCR